MTQPRLCASTSTRPGSTLADTNRKGQSVFDNERQGWKVLMAYLCVSWSGEHQ